MAEPKADQRPSGPDDLFTQFLRTWDDIPAALVDGLLQQAQDDDEREVIRQFGPALTTQFSEISVYFRERVGTLAARQREDGDRFLRMSAALTLAASATTLAKMPKSTALKIGFGDIIHEIKKIIDLLFEVFGWKKPPWWDGLVLLIDEILNDLLSMGIPGLGNVLHHKEVAFLSELRHLALLNQANEERGQDADGE
jgi:hypothetical protein